MAERPSANWGRLPRGFTLTASCGYCLARARSGGGSRRIGERRLAVGCRHGPCEHGVRTAAKSVGA